MQSNITQVARGGTSIKQEQNVVCSAIQKIKHTSSQRGSSGIAKHLMLLWLLVFTLAGNVAWGQVTYTYTTGSNATHTVSEGVDYVIIEAIGGGGAGGSVTNGKRPAGGGGGGAYSRVQVDVSDVLGTSRQISYTVGAGGTNNGDGGNTTVSFGGYTLTANGGEGATAVSNNSTTAGSGANGGAVSNTISGAGISNYHSYAGGNGAGGRYSGSNRYSGGGGGAAGSNGEGNNANGKSGGSAQSPGGYGANGLDQNSNGAAGGNYGGGGSGAYYYSSSNGNNVGGAGASGVVIITEYYSTNTNGANPDIVSRGSNITSMEVDVVANDFISCPNNYTISIVENSAVNGTAVVTADGKKVLFTFPTSYNSENSSFQYSITCGTGESATTTNTATVVIQNSTVVANLGCPSQPTTNQNYYSFPNVEIIGETDATIQYISLAFTNVPDITANGYSFTVTVPEGYSGEVIDLGDYMWAYHFPNGITIEQAKELIADIQVRIPESNTNDFVGVALEISTNYDSRNIIYNAENGHYYELVEGGMNWETAYNAAKNTYYLGMQGYLATITSLAENRFMTALVQAPGWLGGTRMINTGDDPNNPQFYSGFNTTTNNEELGSIWYWACGPEKGLPFMDQATTDFGRNYPGGTGNFVNNRPSGDNLTELLNWYNNYMTRTGYYFNWGTGHSDATGGPEPNNDGGESCLSVLNAKGIGCSFEGTAFELYSWNDLKYNAGGTGGWNATGYIIEYGDLVTGNSVPPLHDGAKCRSIVGLRQETITANVTGKEVQCGDEGDVLAVSVSFIGGMAPYKFDIYEGNTYVSSYSTSGATTIYLPIKRDAKTYTIRDFTSGTITVGGCNVTAATFIIQNGTIEVPATLSYTIEKTAVDCGSTQGATGGFKVTLSGGDASQYPLTVAISSSNSETISTAGGSADFAGLSEGNYIVTITPTKGCVKTDNYNLVVEDVTFTAGNIAGNTEVCEGTTMPTITETTAADGNGTLEFEWYKDGVKIENATSRTYTPSSDLTPRTYVYTRKVKDPCNTNDPNADDNGFVSSGSYTLTINPKPTGVTAVGPEDLICGGGSITLTGSAEEEGLSYKWTKGSSEVCTTTTYTIETTYQSHSGTYVFTATNTTTGCSADASTEIRVTDPIQVAIEVNGTNSYPVTICEGSSATISAEYYNSGDVERNDIPVYTYRLIKEGSTEHINTRNEEYNYTFEPTPGTYILEVTSPDGCVARYTVLTVDQKPDFTLSSSASYNGTNYAATEDATNNCYRYHHGHAITLTATPNTSNNYEGATYQWYKVNGENVEEIANPAEETTKYSGLGTGSMTITSAVVADGKTYRLTITDSKGCSQSKEIAICVNAPYSVSVSANPVDGGTVTGNGTYNHGANATLVATANEGYTFVNWTENGTQVSTSATYSFTVEEDRTLVANFSLNNYEIAANANPTEGGSIAGAGTYDHFATATLTATANTGYTFVNWTENGQEVSTDAEYSFEVSGQRTLVANFSLNNYEIAANANPTEGGSIAGAGTYDHFATATLTATANTGYTFVNWTENGQEVSTDAEYSFEVSGQRILIANFSLNNYEIAANANPTEGGSIAGAGTYDHFATATLTATANTGYTFVNWTENGQEVSTDAEYSFEVSGQRILVANFSLNNYEIAANANPTEGGSIAGAGTYDHFANATLTATANTGYTFVNWTENGQEVSTDAEYSFEVSGQRTLVANFSLNNYEIAANANPTEGGSIAGAGTYDHFATATLTATANTGYTFVNWTENGQEVSTDAEYSFEVSGQRTLVANFSLNNYEIAANANPTEGGSIAGAGTYDHFATATLTATANTGYTFVNWTENGQEVSTDAEYSFEVSGQRTLVANFSLNNYEIAANANPTEGGSIAGAGTYDHFATATLTATTNTGYTFVNWTENGQEVSTYAEYSFEVSGQRILVANFSLNNYEIAANANPTEGGSIAGAGTYDHFANATLTATANTGYTFVNWTENGQEVSTDAEYSFEVSGQRTLVANFSLNNYEIAANANPTEGGSIAGAGTYDHFATATLTATANTGYTFVNWTENGQEVSTDAEYSFEVSGQRTLVANFSLNNYEIAANANPTEGGSIAGAGTYDHFANATLTATANTGYTFVNWTENGQEVSTDAEYSFEVSGQRTLVANFSLNNYEIAANANPTEGGSIAGAGTYDHFATATLTATANTGYTFVNWTENGQEVSTDAEYSFEVSGQRTLVANFSLNNYEIAANANPTEGGSIAGAGTYDHFATATLTATANTGYTFVNWTENGQEVSTDAEYSFEVSGQRTLVANFSLNNYEIAANANPTEGGSIAGAGTYDHFATATLTATTNTGYTFVNWTENGQEVSTDAEYSFEVSGQRILVANFSLNNYEIAANANPTEGGSIAGAGTYDHFANATLTATANTGYTFVNWTENGQEVSTDAEYSFEVSGQRTLVANFSLNNYEIAANANPTEGGSIAGAGTYDHFATATLTATANTGYTFVNWTENGQEVSTDAEYSFEVSGQRILVANFSLNNYEIAANANPAEGGSIAGAGTYDHFATATLTATTNTGYTFVNWTENGQEVSTDAEYSFEVSGQRTLVANFSLNNYEIAANANPTEGGSIAGAGTYDHFATATLTATANTGYTFVNWTENGQEVSTDAEYSFEVSGQRTLVANFSLNNYEIAANANPTEGGSIAGAGTYDHFATATLTATANTGYTFVNWTENRQEVSTDAEYSFEVSGQRILVANFSLNNYEIAANANPAEGGSIAGAGTYDHFATATLTATTNTGYTFVNWTENGQEVSTDAEYSFEVSGQRTLVANFSLNNYEIAANANPTEGGSIAGAGTYDHFATATLTATAATGYTFLNWTNGNDIVSRDANYNFIVEEAVNLVANFSLNTYTISTSGNIEEGGNVTGGGNYEHFTTATLTATPNTCYHFTQWNDGITDNPRTIEVDNDYSFVAMFERNAPLTGDTNIIACDSYTWRHTGVTYIESTIATFSLTNANGCDSTVTLNLTINNSTSGDTNVVACDSYTWRLNGQTYTESTTDTYVLTNAKGCDSTVTLNLTINNSTSGDTNVVACDSYTWRLNGQTYTESTTDTYVLTNAKGCDSTVTLNLTINNSTSGDTNVVACDSYTWRLNGQTYTESTTDTYVLTNAKGCDSTVTLNLTINNSTSGDTNVVACDSYTWRLNGQTYTESTTDTYVLTNAKGCDSTVTLNLTINNSTSGDTNVVACNSYTWRLNGQTYTESTTDTYVLTNAKGCDSTVTLNLTINNSTSGDTNVVACDSYTWRLNGQTYTESTTDTYVLTNAKGCDSTVTLNLTINNSTSGDTNVVACDSYTWRLNGQTYTESTTDTYVLTNAKGCDSTVTLNLTINNSTSGDTNVVACDSYTWRLNGQTYTESTTDTYVLTNAKGCDSTVTLNLTINNSTSGDTNVVACDSYTWRLNGQTYTESTTDTYVLTNAKGCDSIVTLNLTINNSTSGDTNVVACDSYTWRLNGQTYTESTTDTYVLTNVKGCDSTVTLNLTINNSTSGDTNVVACDSYTWRLNDQTYTESTTDTYVLTNAKGCDSIVTLNLTINNSTSGIDTVVAFEKYTWINGETYTQRNNTATYTLTNAAGCDSVVTLNLSIVNIGTNDSVEGGEVIITPEPDTNGTYEYGDTITLTAVADDCYHFEKWSDGLTVNPRDIVLVGEINLNAIFKRNDTLTGIDTVVAYNRYTWIDGVTYTESNNTATWFVPTADGCDSLATLFLSIVNIGTNDSVEGGEVIITPEPDTNGTYEYGDTITLTAVADDCYHFEKWSDGLTVNPRDIVLVGEINLNAIFKRNDTLRGIDTIVAYNRYTWIDGVTYTESNNTATWFVPTADGCDSLATLFLSIVNIGTNDSVEGGEVIITPEPDTNGTYEYGDTITLTAVADDCYHFEKWSDGLTVNPRDIVLVGEINLNAIFVRNAPLLGDTTVVACNSYTWINGVTYTESTIDTYELTTALGCDSIVTLDLTINNSNTGVDVITACDSYTWIDGITYTASNNTATYTLTNAAGCDSVVTLDLTINYSNTGVDVITACDSYTWIDGITYTASNNTATYTLTNAAGCDSVVTLDLTINYSNTGVDVITACDSYTWIDGITYTASNNTATYTLTNAAGCDSVVTLDLTINYSNTGVDVITACDSYTWIDGITYTASNNTATYTLTNAAGCDSVVTLDLTINYSNTGVDVITACDSYTWIDGITYTASNNTATYTLTNAAGCDSVVTLDLTINYSNTGVDVITACDSYTWIDGITYTASNNTATYTLTNAAGCDSVVTLDLTINYSNTGVDVITACDSYTWIDGITYTASNNTATYTLTNAAGCDSVVTLDLTINYSNTGVDVITACDSYTWIDGITYTASNNTATYTLTNAAGCDSVVTLNLTINYSNTGVDVITACDSYTWIDGITYTASNNTATYTLTNAAGCDSVVTLDLTINYSNTGVDVITACDSYTWIDGITYTASNNTATYTLTNAAGCDSVVTLDLTINYSNTGVDVITACDSYTWIDGITYTASNNTATYTLTNAAGCDSVVTLDLTINYSNTGVDVITACDSYTWIDGITYTASNNTATYTLTNAAGCDSVVTLDLTINYSNTGVDVITACDSYTWIDGITYTASNNTATYTLTNAAGCDSVVTLDLTINYSNTGVDVITACDSYTWIDGITYTASNNTATYTLTNAAGCDSVVTLDLTINNSVHQTIFDTAFNEYRWNGEVYTESGVYEYRGQTENGCDSIVTLVLTVRRIDALRELTFYPNPTDGIITFNNDEVLKVELYDAVGKMVSSYENTYIIDLSDLAKGLYIMRVTIPEGTTVKKVILK